MAAVLNTHRSSLRVDKLSNRDMNLLRPRPTAPQHFWGPGRAGVPGVMSPRPYALREGPGVRVPWEQLVFLSHCQLRTGLCDY